MQTIEHYSQQTYKETRIITTTQNKIILYIRIEILIVPMSTHIIKYATYEINMYISILQHCLSNILPIFKSHLCLSLLIPLFREIMLVAWNQSQCEYLHHEHYYYKSRLLHPQRIYCSTSARTPLQKNKINELIMQF